MSIINGLARRKSSRKPLKSPFTEGPDAIVIHPLSCFLNPRSIAVVGASDDVARIGGRTLLNIAKGGFSGPVYPINPRRSTVQGMPAFASIADVPGPVDTVVVAVPGESVIPAIEQAAAKGARGAVIFSAGFNEAGAEGEARQRRLDEIAAESGMRIVGPNCLGIYNVHNGAWLTFTTQFQERISGPSIGMVSQSGGSAAHILKLAQLRGLAVGTFITTGNEGDVEFGEALQALASDPGTSVIVAYIEGIRNGRTLMEGLEAARRAGKPVITLKVGRTEAGAQAAASHTASLAGEDRVYDAIFRAYGVHRATSTEELLDIAYAATRAGGRLPRGKRLGVVTISGGMGAQIADEAAEAGLQLPATDPAAQARLKVLCPPGSPRNPVDITAQLSTDPTLLAASMRILLESGDFDMLFGFFGVYADVPALAGPIMESLKQLRSDYPETVMGLGIICPPGDATRYEEAGFLVFEEPARAVKAIAALAHFAQAFAQPDRDAAQETAAPAPAVAAGTRFNEAEAKQLLVGIGIRAPAECRAATPAEAGQAAAGMAMPVALKIVSPDILHKSDVGGVRLNLRDAVEVTAAAAAIQSSVAQACPDARLEGFLLSEMAPPGVELILGSRRDPLFGALVMVGLGGVTTELFHDVSIRTAPVDRATALTMLESLRSFPLLTGYRGTAAADVEAAVDAIVALSRLTAANPAIETVEINPLRILPAGSGALALDAVIETSSNGSSS